MLIQTIIKALYASWWAIILVAIVCIVPIKLPKNNLLLLGIGTLFFVIAATFLYKYSSSEELMPQEGTIGGITRSGLFQTFLLIAFTMGLNAFFKGAFISLLVPFSGSITAVMGYWLGIITITTFILDKCHGNEAFPKWEYKVAFILMLLSAGFSILPTIKDQLNKTTDQEVQNENSPVVANE